MSNQQFELASWNNVTFAINFSVTPPCQRCGIERTCMTICGLDFGTSNSTIGVLKHKQQTMVPLEQDSSGQWQTTLPSALFFGFEDDEVNVGRRAIGRYTAGEPGRLLRSMKSLLGGSFMGDKTQVKNRLYTFDEIISFFISSLKAQAEEFIGADSSPLESVVMGRPVYFNDTDKALDQAAQEHPDFTLIILAPERHGAHDREQDFLANHGVHIGGTDFDRQLSVNGVMPEFGMGMPLTSKPGLIMPGSTYFDLATWHKIHLLYSRLVLVDLQNMRSIVSSKAKLDRLLELLTHRKGHQLASLVERAKIELSAAPEASVDLKSLFIDSKKISIDNCVLTQTQLQEALQRDIEKIFQTLQETLTQAGLTHQSIDTVFTTGGSTALPMIQLCIDTAFPDAQQIAGDLYNSVGAGLLMEAQLRYG